MNYTNLVNFKYLWVSYYKLKPKEFGSYFPFHALPFIKGQRILNFIPNAKLIEILLRILNNQTKTHIPMRYYTQAILLHYNYSRNTKSLYAIFVRKMNSKLYIWILRLCIILQYILHWQIFVHKMGTKFVSSCIIYTRG